MERFVPSRRGNLPTLKSLVLSILCNVVSRGTWGDLLTCGPYCGAAIATWVFANIIGNYVMN